MPARKSPISVLVVDDSAVIRGVFSKVFRDATDIAVVDAVTNGKQALEAVEQNHVDVVLLDIEMPVMNGLEALPRIRSIAPNTQVLVCSTLSQHNAKTTLDALQAGATDYIPKPTGSVAGAGDDVAEFHQTVLTKVRALGARGENTATEERRSVATRASARERSPGESKKPVTPQSTCSRPGRPTVRPAAIGIAASTGGPQVLGQVLRELKGVEQPVFLTQHMPSTFTGLLAKNLASQTGMTVVEADDGMEVVGGTVYVAPGDYHMVVDGSSAAPRIALKDTAKENYCKPSADPMLKSIVALWGRRSMGVILTGMGHDGIGGCRSLSRAGGHVIVQDQATSTVWGMPGYVAQEGLADKQVPIDAIGTEIRQFAGKAAGVR